MEHNQEKALHLLGIARKANRLAIGEEPAGIACRSGKARLLLVAQDAGEHTVRRAQSFCRSGKPAWMQVGFTKEELGNGLGCNACALCAVLDPALAKAFVETLGTDHARAKTPAGREGPQEQRQTWEEITGGGCIEY